MRIGWALCLMGLCAATGGCQLAKNAVENLANETKLATADVHERCRYQKSAEAHWNAVQKSSTGKQFSKDYARGFTDGFIDLVQFGGTGQAPDLPPKHYWGSHYRTPEGYRAVEDWYAGFRHGAAAAQVSGQRQWATVPSAQSTAPTACEPPHSAPTLLFEPQPEIVTPPTRSLPEPKTPEIKLLPLGARLAPPRGETFLGELQEPLRPSGLMPPESALGARMPRQSEGPATLPPPPEVVQTQWLEPPTSARPSFLASRGLPRLTQV